MFSAFVSTAAFVVCALSCLQVGCSLTASRLWWLTVRCPCYRLSLSFRHPIISTVSSAIIAKYLCTLMPPPFWFFALPLPSLVVAPTTGSSNCPSSFSY
ncbi:uncharacterized protein EDB93DRAFT_1162906 [Suillus bovinus]|uniref:uncharacterized protein n=1 Tax=Suillus bovinus TaxID=48563 RepID=UPI001B8762BD|nr:uncharacterized protein EDB93DRAFT_1162906 [Suillus bovinus]KAG2139853.1 hypothetical protein EDB93DRAFT_1162906 [Suillus bovinus]